MCGLCFVSYGDPSPAQDPAIAMFRSDLWECFVAGKSSSSLQKNRRRSTVGVRGSPETNCLIRFIAQQRSLKKAVRSPMARDPYLEVCFLPHAPEFCEGNGFTRQGFYFLALFYSDLGGDCLPCLAGTVQVTHLLGV